LVGVQRELRLQRVYRRHHEARRDVDWPGPRPVDLITANLYARTRQASGGLIQQAIAAIENALVDVKAKALGVPVCEMLGWPIRDRRRLYWSHCGTYRLYHAEKMGLPPIRTLDDIVAFC
jgi:galactonate dehydratase